ncbi:MAG: alpha/beta hydrolase [Euryarchaeota archaeon]|nr:alpha/beta hydrolase [Euryarchaeota archaeon]
MSIVKVNDIKLYYEERGYGFPLILLHGLGSDHSIWEASAPEFSKKYKTFSLDLRGHGSFDKPKIHYSIDLFSRDVLKFMEEKGIYKANIIGHSMGGSIAQQTALKYPEMVRSLILVSTFSYVDKKLRETFKTLLESLDKGGYSLFFDKVLELANTPQFLFDNREFILARKKIMAKKSSIDAVRNSILACLGWDISNSISDISVPTLIIAGNEDILTRINLSEYIHHSIKDSQLIILDGVGHNLMVEKPKEFSQMVTSFLGRYIS